MGLFPKLFICLVFVTNKKRENSNKIVINTMEIKKSKDKKTCCKTRDA